MCFIESVLYAMILTLDFTVRILRIPNYFFKVINEHLRHPIDLVSAYFVIIPQKAILHSL